ncbi:MAG: DedA family protein [Pyramidobacter sp.]|nr:DedA family protein [Pyramidobacter sp.]
MLSEMFGWLVEKLVETIGSMGYAGIVGLMFLESSFFPFPSEVVMPPAGYLAHEGQMSLALVLIAGIVGSLLGALFNYWLSLRYGRPFFEKYGKHFGVTSEVLDKADAFFARHGHISTFVGRLIPVIRQYISLPAGIARMNLPRFCFYTSLGAGIWVVILTLLGYWMGKNKDLIHSSLNEITIALVIFCSALTAGYIWRLKRRKQKKSSTPSC